ncbi:MAG TPA: MFS transporter, partial [Acidimicrobiales bacterium]|nr:MFS transporter [Acidimicrobiales bacterium]
TATGATGFSVGLVFGGALSTAGWRYVFFVPVAVAAITLLGAVKFVPETESKPNLTQKFDISGAVALTAAVLLMVFTVVEAPLVGWATGRTIGSFAGAIAILAAFVSHERRVEAPLVRLGILRSSSLVRANFGAMALFGGWIGFQFIAMLYMQQLRGWSPLHAGLSIFPAGVVVALLAPRLQLLIERFGIPRLILVGLASTVAAYSLFLPIGHGSSYLAAMLPTFLLAGLGFGLAYGPLNMAATNGIAPHEQGLAGGLLNTSFQFGGALVLAIVTAVNNAASKGGHTSATLLHGFKTAIIVSVVAASIGVAASLLRRLREAEPDIVVEVRETQAA